MYINNVCLLCVWGEGGVCVRKWKLQYVQISPEHDNGNHFCTWVLDSVGG